MTTPSKTSGLPTSAPALPPPEPPPRTARVMGRLGLGQEACVEDADCRGARAAWSDARWSTNYARDTTGTYYYSRSEEAARAAFMGYWQADDYYHYAEQEGGLIWRRRLPVLGNGSHIEAIDRAASAAGGVRWARKRPTARRGAPEDVWRFS